MHIFTSDITLYTNVQEFLAQQSRDPSLLRKHIGRARVAIRRSPFLDLLRGSSKDTMLADEGS